VRVVPAREMWPPAATLAGVTVPKLAVPAVPVGRLMVIELSVDVVAVVKE
jgi:hypothetical protein